MYNYPQISSQDYEVLAAISSYFFCKRAEATLPKKRLSIVFERKKPEKACRAQQEQNGSRSEV